MKKKIIAGCLVSAAAVGAYWVSSPRPEVSTEPLTAGAQAVAVQPVAAREPVRCDFAGPFANSYVYSAGVTAVISMEGMPQPVENRSEVSATLALEKLRVEGVDTVLIGQFVKPNETFLKLYGEKVASPFLVKVGPSCDLKGFARAKSTSLKSAQAQQVTMYDFFIKAPASGTSEQTYENGTGLARATFGFEGGVVTRRITSYDVVWRVKGGLQVNRSSTRVTLGAGFIETFESDEAISGGLLQVAAAQVRLAREKVASAGVAAGSSRNAADYEWSNLLSGVFKVESLANGAAPVPPEEQRYVEVMKNSTIDQAFDAMALHAQEKANVNDQWHEMTGFLNGHPEQIAKFAEGLRADDYPEGVKAISYLALSKTSPIEARVALEQLRGDGSLQTGDRIRASLALVSRKDVGPELAKAMKRDALVSQTGDAEADFFARNTLLHLGVLAGEHKYDAETVAVAREAIKTQLSAAGADTYLLGSALGAAGNLGDATLLADAVGYTRSPDWRVRELVPKALRGYPYAEVEAVWAEWLARETHPDVKTEIFDSIYHQLATAQRKAGPAIVSEAVKHLRMKPLVLARQSIINLIGPVKNDYPEVKALLMVQMAEEFKNQSGLYSQITQYLDAPEIELALSRMPEFAHQYGAAQRRQLEQAVIDLEQEKRTQQQPQDVSSVFK